MAETKWEAGVVPEPKAWTLTHTIMVAMGVIILTLAGLGYDSIKTSINTGDTQTVKVLSDTAINLSKMITTNNDNLLCQIKEIKEQHRDTSATILKLVTDVARLDANQKARLDKELPHAGKVK